MLKDFSTSIVQTLRQRGFQAYLVGGCVRDLLLGREPKDYDVATIREGSVWYLRAWDRGSSWVGPGRLFLLYFQWHW